MERSGPKLRKSICGRGGLAGKLRRTDADELGIVREAAGLLLVYFAGPAAIWYPLVAAAGVVLVKRGLKNYCANR
jgi:hypothetical protein